MPSAGEITKPTETNLIAAVGETGHIYFRNKTEYAK
jgi:hypothetical protein